MNMKVWGLKNQGTERPLTSRLHSRGGAGVEGRKQNEIQHKWSDLAWIISAFVTII